MCGLLLSIILWLTPDRRLTLSQSAFYRFIHSWNSDYRQLLHHQSDEGAFDQTGRHSERDKSGRRDDADARERRYSRKGLVRRGRHGMRRLSGPRVPSFVNKRTTKGGNDPLTNDLRRGASTRSESRRAPDNSNVTEFTLKS